MKPHDTAPHSTVVTSTSPYPRDAAWMDAHWMPYTGNRNFKANPRMMVSAKGAYYTDQDGRQIFDGLSGLWCCGLGHSRPEITEAVSRQIGTMEYSPAFQYGHPLSFELANKITQLMPEGLDRVFLPVRARSARTPRSRWRALLACQRPGHQNPPDRPRKGLPRRELWRHLGGRHRAQPQDVWPGH